MRRKILISDDEPMIRAAIRGALSDLAEGFEVCAEAANGKEMVALAQKHFPDIFLVDIKMPGMGGLDAIRECQSMVPGAAFLILSGVNDFQDARVALQLGVVDYLLKPVRPAELQAAIRLAAARVDEERRILADTLVVRTHGDSTWVTGGALLFLDDPLFRPQFAPTRADALRERIRTHLGLRLRSGFLLTVLPGASSSVEVLWALRSDHPDRAELEDWVRSSLADLLVAAQAAPGLVTPVFIPAQERTSGAIGSLRGLQADPLLRFLAMGDAGWTSASELRSRGHTLEDRAFWASLDGIVQAVGRRDRPGFQSHLQGLRKAAKPSGAEDLRRVQAFLGQVLEVPPDEGWIDALAARADAWFGESTVARSTHENPVIAEIRRLVAEDGLLDLGIKQIAGRLGLSANYLSTLFHSETGMTFVRYLTEARMARALTLVRDSRIPLKELAPLCGYGNRSYFDKVFAAAFGVTPADYRASLESCSSGHKSLLS